MEETSNLHFVTSQYSSLLFFSSSRKFPSKSDFIFSGPAKIFSFSFPALRSISFSGSKFVHRHFFKEVGINSGIFISCRPYRRNIFSKLITLKRYNCLYFKVLNSPPSVVWFVLLSSELRATHISRFIPPREIHKLGSHPSKRFFPKSHNLDIRKLKAAICRLTSTNDIGKLIFHRRLGFNSKKFGEIMDGTKLNYAWWDFVQGAFEFILQRITIELSRNAVRGGNPAAPLPLNLAPLGGRPQSTSPKRAHSLSPKPAAIGASQPSKKSLHPHRYPRHNFVRPLPQGKPHRRSGGKSSGGELEAERQSSSSSESEVGRRAFRARHFVVFELGRHVRSSSYERDAVHLSGQTRLLLHLWELRGQKVNPNLWGEINEEFKRE